MQGSDLKKPTESKGSMKDRSFERQTPAPSYTLIFLDAAKNTPQGTERTTDASYLSIGRDSSCEICYGDDYPMVSRLHAVIEWRDDDFVIKHLSNTNQTLLNGRPIAQKWYLHDDDVIQLSPSGPKIKFKRPLVLNMKQQPAKQQSAPKEKKPLVKEKQPSTAKPKNLYNISLVAVIVLAVLLTALMVYLTISGV